MEREEGREGLDKEVEGETPLTTTTTMTSGIQNNNLCRRSLVLVTLASLRELFEDFPDSRLFASLSQQGSGVSLDEIRLSKLWRQSSQRLAKIHL